MPLPYVIAPAGVTPASFWEPNTFVDPGHPPAFLADDIDIDTGDFASMLTRVHPVDAAVKEAFRLTRGTGAAVQEAGQRFGDIRKQTQYTATEIERECRRIMQPFADRGDLSIVDITVDSEIHYDMSAALVRYINLRTGQPKNVRPGR